MSKVNFDRLDEYGYEVEPQRRFKRSRHREGEEEFDERKRSDGNWKNKKKKGKKPWRK